MEVPSPFARAEAALRQAVEHLTEPTTAGFERARTELTAAVRVLERAACPDPQRRVLSVLVKQAAKLLHHGASMRMACAALSVPTAGQYGPAGKVEIASRPSRAWEG
ncbi:MAG: hypothetical protein U0Q16_10495 [Bryobacteraceae bacterium]